MPYERDGTPQTAERLGHTPILESDLVRDELEKMETKEVDIEDIDLDDRTCYVTDLDLCGREPKALISIDGSLQEVQTNDEYPENRIGYIQIAGVLTRLDYIDEADERFVDPAMVEKMDETELLSAVLPSSNFMREDAETVKESWRKQVYEVFTTRKIEGKSFLDILMEVSEEDERYIDQENIKVYSCPNPDCGFRDEDHGIQTHVDDLGECEECGTVTYPTDALRTHERVDANQSNRGAITPIMTVLEHLTMCLYLNWFSEVNRDLLSKVGFIIDGPLAIYDTPSWLHSAILENIERVYNRQREDGHEPPIIVGLEKSGRFKQHAENIAPEMDRGTILSMDNEYIYNNIKTGTTENEYGEREHYGWPFIYKSRGGRSFVLKMPSIPDGEAKYNPQSHYLMRRTLEAIEKVETAVYDDATIPITLAHEKASIPMGTGSRVLELFAEDEAEIT